jgi:hypothetical protein
VRDTAAFVDHCRGGAPGEFMPYWTPAEPLCNADRARPAAAAHRAVARMGRLPRHAGTSWPSSNAPAASSKAWATTSTGRCRRSTTARRSRRRPPATSATSRRPSPTCWPRAGCTRPPAELIEPINIRIWEAGNTSVQPTRADAGASSTPPRAASAPSSSLGRDPDADHRAAHAAHRHHRVPDAQRQPVGAGLVRQPVAQLRLHAADQPVRHPRAFRCRWARRQRACRWASRHRPDRPATACCCSWPRRSSGRSVAAGTTAGRRGWRPCR